MSVNKRSRLSLALEELKRLFARRGFDHLPAELVENQANDVPHERVVLSDEYFVRHERMS
jgi:hypothetical protein